MLPLGAPYVNTSSPALTESVAKPTSLAYNPGPTVMSPRSVSLPQTIISIPSGSTLRQSDRQRQYLSFSEQALPSLTGMWSYSLVPA